MNGIDLNQFQFDYDQTWAVMFLRHDGTVLARYGTRGDTNGMTYNSLEGLTATMRTVLNVDRDWQPAMQKQYASKVGPKMQHATADQIPSQTISRILDREGQGNQSCIHCHNVYDGLRDDAIRQRNYDPAKRFKYPMPQNIGLSVDRTGTTIIKVSTESAASEAGLRAGQLIDEMNGQPIHSLADIQFVLHHLADRAEVTVATHAPGSDHKTTATLTLPSGWKRGNIGWRASMYGMPPKPGLWVEAATDEEKTDLDIKSEDLALKVRGVFGNEVRQAGLKKGDVIIQFGDRSDHHSEGDFHAHLRLHYFAPNAKLRLKLLRDGKRVEKTVTFANK